MDFALDKLKDFVENKTGSCRMLTVGDVMLDKYYYGEVTRISPEAPVPVTRVTSTKETLGGAANVAHNLALLGCQTEIVGFVGDDFHCKSLREKFKSRGIGSSGLVYTDAPTTTKLRVIGGHQQMIRLDFEETEPPDEKYRTELMKQIDSKIAAGIDGVVISDYGKGVCTGDVCAHIVEECAKRSIPVVVDPKGRDWERYEGADYVTPNLKELNEILPNRIKNIDEAVEQGARYAMEKFGIENVITTRSECGLTLVQHDGAVHIPTIAQEVFDVSGAGDTVIAVFAMALSGGMTAPSSAYLANLAASVVVAKLGTYAVSKEELLQALNNISGC